MLPLGEGGAKWNGFSQSKTSWLWNLQYKLNGSLKVLRVCDHHNKQYKTSIH